MKLRIHSLPLACALALSPLLIAPTQARAQELATNANAQYRKAFAALAKKNWAEARRLLLPLWHESRTWDVASGLGQAEFLLENRAAGATYTAFALANVPPKEKPSTTERLQAALDEMKEAVGTVRVVVNEDGAAILVDREVVGRSPLAREVYLDPGTRLLQARFESGALSEQTIEVEAGKFYQVALTVERPAAEEGLAAPADPRPMTASPNAAPPVPDASVGTNWAPVLVTGGLALAAAAIGTGFAIDAHSAKTNASDALTDAEAQFGDNPCTPSKGGGSDLCRSVQDAGDRRKRSHTVATVSFAISGVFAAAAVGSYFLWAKPSTPRVDAWLGPEGGGLRLKGNF